MAIRLEKGQKIDLTKSNPGLEKVIVGLGWDTNKFDGNSDFDLDASVFLLNDQKKVAHDEDLIFYNNPRGRNDAVIHTGDNRTGAGEGDDEQILVELTKIPTDVQKIAFTVTIHDAETRKQNFGQVNNAFIRIINEKNQEELLRFDLGEDFSIETALVFAELYRHEGEWKFAAVGMGYQGGLKALCQSYDLAV